MALEGKLKAKYKEELDNVDDVEELTLDALATIDIISDGDKKYLERFKSLSMLSMNYLGLTTVANMPTIPTLKHVCRLESSRSCNSMKTKYRVTCPLSVYILSSKDWN